MAGALDVDATVRFSELREAKGPQMVCKLGSEAVVVVSAAERRRLTALARPTLKDLLLTDEARSDDLLPTRAGGNWRPPAAVS